MPRPAAGASLLIESFTLLAVTLAGCTKPPVALAPTRPPEVVVDRPVVRDVTDFEDFTGRTEAVSSVEVRSRVTGYLEGIHFQDGTDVAKDALLFRIDPKPYQAEFDRTEATVKQAEAHLARVQKDYDRAVVLRTTGAISPEELDRTAGDRSEADAALAVAKAARKLAQQNLDYTKIIAPFAGRIGRRHLDAGNLVKADETILTTIVALDAVYANFDVDDRTLLRVRRLVRDGRVADARARKTHVRVGLPDEDEHSLEGIVDFDDNKVDPGTGTLRFRAEVQNPPLHGHRLLSPGMFVRIRLPIGDPRRAVLIPEEALGTDQGQKFVYVVNAADEVVYRPVKPGSQYGPLRVVETGLAGDERVIVSGLQRVRPGVKVTPRQAESKSGDSSSPGPPSTNIAGQSKPTGPTRPAAGG
jgi:RND family efflux transporter MFP subunit